MFMESIKAFSKKKEREKIMKIILTYGTFDLLHYGHIEYLKKAKQMGDFLIVGVSNDKFNQEKGKNAYFTFEKRKEMISAIRYVDKVIEQSSFEQKKDDILKYNVDILVSSEDWEGKYDYLKDICEVIYLPRYPEISTTQIKKDLKI